jgi:uracil-DNA glycosylase
LLKNKEIRGMKSVFPQEVVAHWPALAGTWPVLERVADAESSANPFYPPADQRYNALKLCSLEQVRAVILGQDPYHGPGQAHGLAFSVPRGTPLPPSLKNIFKELQTDQGGPLRTSSDLSDWAQQGVLLLNTAWTVAPGAPGSHARWGWSDPVQAVLRAVAEQEKPVVFVAWGNAAQKEVAHLDLRRHALLASAHPSPLGAYRGFWGSRPFGKINDHLLAWGRLPVQWNGYL